MDKKCLLVLGIGHSQLDLIEEAKKLNYRVAACANSLDGPGLALVDDYRQIDILDEKKVEDYARELDAQAIFSMGLEIVIPLMNRVSKRMGLRYFQEPQSLKKIYDKAIWRGELGDIPGNLKFQVASRLDELDQWTYYPAVIKPVDGSGQRGVIELKGPGELKEKFSTSLGHSKKGQVIIEEYAFGEEVSANVYVHKGELLYYFLSDRVAYDEFPGGIIKEHLLPSRYAGTPTEKKVEQLVKDVCRAMDFKEGHVYFQIKVDEEGQPRLIEFTPRYDGCHMWKFIDFYSGVNLVSLSLSWLLEGRLPELVEPAYRPGKYKLRFISDVPKTIVMRKNYQIPPEADFLNWYYQDNEEVKTVTGYMEKMGYYITEVL